MKQDDKTCATCLNYDCGYCKEGPKVASGETRHGEAIWNHPWVGKGDYDWCSRGKWRDENGRIHGWIEVQGDRGF